MPGGTGTALINTVANKRNYTVRDYRMAELAHKVQCMIGNPVSRITSGLLTKPVFELPSDKEIRDGRQRHLWSRHRLPKNKNSQKILPTGPPFSHENGTTTRCELAIPPGHNVHRHNVCQKDCILCLNIPGFEICISRIYFQ